MGRRLDDPFFFSNFAGWNYKPPFEKGFNEQKCIISYFQSMRYSTIVEQDDKTLLEIISALEHFEQSRFIAGIQARKYTPFQILQTLDMVRVYQLRMNMEARSLTKFSETFIQQFATDNNKCFVSAERYFNRIRSTLCALKKVFHKTCQRSMVQLPDGKQPSVFERSPLAKGAYVVDMFGLESYDEVVQQLYVELDTLLTSATNILGLCHQMIENEAMIREDVEQLKLIYHESCQSLLSSVKEYADFMGASEHLPETDLNKRKAKAGSMKEFLQKEYHNVAKKEFKKFVWLEAVRQGRSGGLTEEETYLWVDDYRKVHMVRWAIEHFDELNVEGQQGKIDSTLIVYFLKWCGVETKKERRLYTYFCDNYKGRLQPLVWSAVSKERKEQRESGITDRGSALTFQRMLDALPKPMAV